MGKQCEDCLHRDNVCDDFDCRFTPARQELWLRIIYVNQQKEDIKLKTYSSRYGDSDFCEYYWGNTYSGTIGKFVTNVLPKLESGNGLLLINNECFDVGFSKWILIRNIISFEILDRNPSEPTGIYFRQWE